MFIGDTRMCDSVVLYNCTCGWLYCTTVWVRFVLYNCLGEWLYCTTVWVSGCTIQLYVRMSGCTVQLYV